VDLKTTARPLRFVWLFPLMTAFLVALTFIPAPRQPYLLDDALSDEAVLSYANQHQWHFGTEIVFTYGPWGYLVSRRFLPHQHGTQMAIVTLLSFVVAAGVCLVAWRFNLLWRVLLVAIFVYLTANIDPRADVLIYSAILFWGWLCLVTSGIRWVFYSFCFALVAVFGIMVKANFLFVALLGTVFISTESLLKGRVRAALLLPLGLGSLFTLAWLSAGQSLLQLPAFFANAWSIIQGYDQVVGLDAPVTFVTRAFLVVIFALAATMIRALNADPLVDAVPFHRAQWRSVLISAWLCMFIFVVWKHGFVRADLYHMGFFFGVVPLMALSLELLPCSRPLARLCSRGLVLACCAIAVVTVQSLFSSSLKSSLAQPFAGLRENLKSLLQPSIAEHAQRELYEKARAAAQLPSLSERIGRSTVDVFGQQCYAIFNNMNYHARPVFQTYLAYNDRLASLNEQFYLSQNAPKYVLFRLNAADRKFPPLEDSHFLRHLLLNFSSSGAEAPFLLLESRTSDRAKLKLLRQGTAGLNERVHLPENKEGCIWLEVSIEPNWRGRLIQLFYKPGKTRIAFWAPDMKKALNRSGAPAPMLAAGFIASPLLLKTQDVRDFFDGASMIRPAAFSIELSPEFQRYWKPTFLFRIYSVEKQAQTRAQIHGRLELHTGVAGSS
jgi:hypothetical protein